jgi:hypothetical protein
MVLPGLYLKKLLTILRSEVLVLPSRIIVALFFIVLLGMPFVSQNPYLIRVIILTSIFAILAASWDLLSGFTGQMNFGHALFFGVGDSLSPAQRHLPGPDDHGLSYYFNGDRVCPARSDRR